MMYFVVADEKIVYSLKGSVELTNKEYLLFIALVNHASNGQLIDRDDLLSLIWPEREMTINNNNIHQLFSRLKKKAVLISDDFELQSLRGKSYKVNNKKNMSVRYINHNSIFYRSIKIIFSLYRKIFKRNTFRDNVDTP
ncbi:helix-turn-helix domain-containing protein [Yersinia nurmii]|uniref:Helix-turn-helix domain-containing protein n=1 Tax=Yersinia nurmii TaxID=685706 RepID=A0AAW7K8E5_9GAMM|nr:helix-turn-helix domain-containing protein [Yersinia nurmii]MDN0089339.1 helix-turn-helix domain-containing protein [Yersinia nurmii]CNE17900.1 Transcriptional regulatory protein%2C C terminal [Yersinia nurmii]